MKFVTSCEKVFCSCLVFQQTTRRNINKKIEKTFPKVAGLQNYSEFVIFYDTNCKMYAKITYLSQTFFNVFSWSLWNSRGNCEWPGHWGELRVPWYGCVSVSARLPPHRLIGSNLSPRQPMVWTAPHLHT